MEFPVGDWTAVRSTNELVKGTIRVRLEGRAMEVLQLLYDKGGEVVSKNELIDAVWKLQVVSDHSITVVISDLRKALGDNPRDPRYIETIPKKGYRLLGEHSCHATPQVPSPQHEQGRDFKPAQKTRGTALGLLFVAAAALLAVWWVASTTTDAPPSLPVRMVVLDAINTTNDPSVDALASSITELTLDGMSRAKKIELVRWRQLPTEERLVESKRDDLILETRVIDAEDTRLLAMTLKHVGTGAIRWTTTQAVSLRHFRLAQDKALRELSRELELGDMPTLRPVFSAVAEEVFWRARYLWSSRQQAAAIRAQSLLLDVLDMEPAYYSAHAALADLYSHKTGSFFNGVVKDPLALARFHVERAASINPIAVEVLLARSHIALFADGEPEQALTYLVDVVDQAPNSATAWVSYANALAATGQFDKAVDAIDKAQRADPMDPSVLLDKVWILLLARQFDDALLAARDTEKLGLPVDLYRGLIYGAKGDHSVAIDGWLGFLGQTIPPEKARQISDAASAGKYLSAYEVIGSAIIGRENNASPIIAAIAYGLAENYLQTRAILESLSGSEQNWVALWARHVPVISRAYENGLSEAS